MSESLEVLETEAERNKRFSFRLAAILSLAIDGKKEEILAILDDNPGLVNYKAYDSWDVLQAVTARRFARVDIVEAVLLRGATTCLNEAANLASHYGHNDVLELLIRWGADPHLIQIYFGRMREARTIAACRRGECDPSLPEDEVAEIRYRIYFSQSLTNRLLQRLELLDFQKQTNVYKLSGIF